MYNNVWTRVICFEIVLSQNVSTSNSLYILIPSFREYYLLIFVNLLPLSFYYYLYRVFIVLLYQIPLIKNIHMNKVSDDFAMLILKSYIYLAIKNSN